MARRDYICCKSCDCKLIYDGYDYARDALNAQYGTMDLICPDCLKELETKLAELEQSKQEPAQAVPVAGIDQIEQLAQQAYLEYINQLKQDICLGVEYKMEQGTFGKAELAAHKNAQLWLGKHKAFREAAILLKRLEIDQ